MDWESYRDRGRCDKCGIPTVEDITTKEVKHVYALGFECPNCGFLTIGDVHKGYLGFRCKECEKLVERLEMCKDINTWLMKELFEKETRKDN